MKTYGLVIFFTMALTLVAMSSAKVDFYPCAGDHECHHEFTCYQNACVNACVLRNSNVLGNKCGENAKCMTWEPHSAVCGCQPFHIGNPDVGCKKVSHAEYFADLNRRNLEARNKQ